MTRSGLSTDANASLLGLLAKHGMHSADLSSKSITYKMVENVLVSQRYHNVITNATKSLKAFKSVVPVSYSQVGVVLAAVKHKMRVSYISNIEADKTAFASSDTLGFGKWLTLNVMQQSVWTQVKHNADSKLGADGKLNTDKASVLAYVTEGAYCNIAAVVDEFTEDIVNARVLALITSKSAAQLA